MFTIFQMISKFTGMSPQWYDQSCHGDIQRLEWNQVPPIFVQLNDPIEPPTTFNNFDHRANNKSLIATIC